MPAILSGLGSDIDPLALSELPLPVISCSPEAPCISAGFEVQCFGARGDKKAAILALRPLRNEPISATRDALAQAERRPLILFEGSEAEARAFVAQHKEALPPGGVE